MRRAFTLYRLSLTTILVKVCSAQRTFLHQYAMAPPFRLYWPSGNLFLGLGVFGFDADAGATLESIMSSSFLIRDLGIPATPARNAGVAFLKVITKPSDQKGLTRGLIRSKHYPPSDNKTNKRMGGRAVYCTGLENRRRRKASVGSNPSPSAFSSPHTMLGFWGRP